MHKTRQFKNTGGDTEAETFKNDTEKTDNDKDGSKSKRTKYKSSMLSAEASNIPK